MLIGLGALALQLNGPAEDLGQFRGELQLLLTGQRGVVPELLHTGARLLGGLGSSLMICACTNLLHQRGVRGGESSLSGCVLCEGCGEA